MLLGNGFELVPLRECWNQYSESAKEHGATPPQYASTEHGLAVTLGGKFVAGFVLWPTPGHICLAERLVASPNARPRDIVKAIEHLVFGAMAYAEATGKQLVSLNSSPGVRSILERMGVGGRVGLEVLAVSVIREQL